jgi:paraquat-inducible protein B
MNIRPAVVGGFILGALALGVGAILFFGGLRLFATTARVVVFFDESVAGLDVGAPVTFHGVRVGSVQSISIRYSADTMAARIPVFLELDPSKMTWEGKRSPNDLDEFARLARAGLRAELAQQSLVTGQLRIDLSFRPETPARTVGMMTDVPEIPTAPSDLAQFRDQITQLPLRELVDTAQRTLTSIGRLSDRLDTTLDPLAESARRTADTATQTLDTINGAVRELHTEAATTLHDLDGLLIDARHQLDARGGDLHRTLAAADGVARRAQTLLDSLNSLTEPRSPFRGDLEAALRDLAAGASSLRGFAETVERNPNALLMGRKGGQ